MRTKSWNPRAASAVLCFALIHASFGRAWAQASSKPTPPTAAAAEREILANIGWKAIDDDALARAAGLEKGYIPGSYLSAAGIEWINGRLRFSGSGDEIGSKSLPMVLEGLWIFVTAGKDPVEAGHTLASWGLPPVIEGRKLVNPDGSATYYGEMLRQIYSERPDALKLAGHERLSQALDLLLHAHAQAFAYQAPDVAKADVDRAKLILFAPPREGETSFTIKPYRYIPSLMNDFASELAADRDEAALKNDYVREKDSAAALDVLNTLQRQRYHPEIDLPAVPLPGQTSNTGAGGQDPMNAPVNVPLSSGLPRLLQALDRINGKPLTPDQEENLIKSFPMGDLIWRLGAQNFWRQGLTGKHVKMAIIDGGIGKDDELANAVKGRANMTADRGWALSDDHGTHVAGIAHAVAPDAEIRGYTVLPGKNANPALAEEADTLVPKAIDRAVQDGNRIISMSLAVQDGPSDPIARKVEEYSKQGVIFIVAAGNYGNKAGMTSPAAAPNAIAVGDTYDDSKRADPDSSYGADFDARKLLYVVKSVFMAPGTNIYSTVIDASGKQGYELMSGTSMATPAVSGTVALLMQAASALTPNPVALSGRVMDALTEGSRPISREKLPPDVPFDQKFLLVSPQGALDALRRQAAPATARN